MGRRALGATAAAVTVTALAGCGGEQPLQGGTGLLVAAPVPVGKPLSYGQLSIGNESDRPIRIDEVTVAGDPQIEVLAVKALNVRYRGHLPGIGVGFPWRRLKNWLEPVEGLVVPPLRKGDPGVPLIVGLQVNTRGTWELKSVTIRYRQGDERFTRVLEAPLRLCAPGRTACSIDGLE